MIYLYDDTFDGLMTAIFEIYERRDMSAEIAPASRGDVPSLFEMCRVSTDMEKSERVQNGLRRLNAHAARRVYIAWLSHAEGVEDLILAACRIGFANKANPFSLRQYDAIVKLDGWACRVGWDTQRMLQFVRFVKLSDDFYFSDVQPEYDVLPLIGDHFHKRFPDCRFVIRDTQRRRAIVSDPNGWHIADVPGEIEPVRADGDYEEMWRAYFKIISIAERKNLKLQQKFVPKKHRKYMTEFMEDEG